MAITPLPPAPESTDSTAQFNSKAFAWVASLEDFVTETNATAVTVNAYATTATTQAGIATTQSGIATTQAGISATQAGISTTKAAESLASANNAATSASNALASEQAALASEVAADNSADSATASASSASTSASSATTSASAASTSESNASGYAVQASNSATASANSATASANSASASATSADASATSAETAAAATNAVLWVSGTTYAIGFLVYSPLDKRAYRRLTAGAGTTDPSLDATNWSQLTRVVEQSDIGTAPNEIPLNQYLGSLAYQSSESAIIESGRIDLKGGGSNLFSFSEQFDNAYWGKTNATVITDSIIAPDGTLTADTLTENTVTGLHNLSRSIDFSTPIGSFFSFSVFAKANGRTQLRLATAHGAGGGSIFVDFDLVAETATPTGTNVSGSIVDVGDGWYRCNMVGQDNQGGNRGATINLLSTGAISYAGDGTSGMYVWGAQIEESTTVGNYVETEATSAPFNNVLGATALSVIPTNGFDTTYPLAFELASNTSLIVKVKGSDGTVRSATLTLA